MIYTVTFNPAVDVIMYVKHLEFGITNRSVWEEISFGGKGINVSRVLTTLGVENKALGFVAGFTGNALASALRQSGVRTDFITLPEGNTRINAKLRGCADEAGIVAQDVETGINSSGPSIDEASLRMLLEQLGRTREGDVLVVSGGVPNNIDSQIYGQIIEPQVAKGVLCVVDATGSLLMNALAFRPFLIKPNNEEVAEIFGIDRDDPDQLADGARELQRRGARNVLLSRGADGSMLLDETGRVRTSPGIEGRLVNSVGAGDSMVAGFLTGFVQAREAGAADPFERAFRYAQAAGAATAFSQGLATRSHIESLLEKAVLA